MEDFVSGGYSGDITEETIESLTLDANSLGISEGVTIGMTVSAVALVLSIGILNIISFFRRA